MSGTNWQNSQTRPFLLLLVPEAVLLLIVTLVVVVPVGVVVLVGRVELLPLLAVGDEVGGIVALEAAPN
jgi:hypothetical protein